MTNEVNKIINIEWEKLNKYSDCMVNSDEILRWDCKTNEGKFFNEQQGLI